MAGIKHYGDREPKYLAVLLHPVLAGCRGSPVALHHDLTQCSFTVHSSTQIYVGSPIE